jgi:hypothetical protein
MLLAILHVLPDSEEPYRLARRFNERLGPVQSQGRSREEVSRFFSGLDLVPPGIITTPKWRPDPGTEPPGPDPAYAGVARKPAG